MLSYLTQAYQFHEKNQGALQADPQRLEMKLNAFEKAFDETAAS